MKAIVTICSREKDDRQTLLKASKRYLGDHIGKTKKIATESGEAFFILSGKYGLISAETEIPYYDYYLENSKVDDLADKVSKQIKKQDITSIDSYLENKKSWEPYKMALEKGALLASIPVSLHEV